MSRHSRRWPLIAAALILAAVVTPVSATQPVAPLLGWGHGFSGSESNRGFSVAVHSTGDVYVTGHFTDTVDFDPGAGTQQLSAKGAADIVLAKYRSDGSLEWAHAFGGTTGFSDTGRSVAVDSAGNVYLAGSFAGLAVDFDPGSGEHLLDAAGGTDIVLAKYDADGSLQWAHAFGDDDSDHGRGVAVDTAGNVFVTGQFRGTVDFDPGAGTHQLMSGDNGAATSMFLAKYTTDGDLEWAHVFGGDDPADGFSPAVDAFGNVHVTGWFVGAGVDFDPGPGTHPLTSGDNGAAANILLVKYTTDGDLLWAHSLGGDLHDSATGLAVDALGNVYLAGEFFDTVDFDPGPGTRHLTSEGSGDIVLAKYDADGNLLWAHGFGGSEYDTAIAVAVDPAGNAYVTGGFRGGNVDFDPGSGTANLTSAGSDDAFVAAYRPDGSLGWARSFGDTDNDIALAIAADANGAVYLTGSFRGTIDVDPGPGAHSLNSDPTSQDMFLLKWAQPDVTRLAGANRFETAGAVALHHYPGGAVAAFVATGLNFPDALTGAGPAGLNAAPLLLTGSIPQSTADALDALGLSEIIVLGGPAAVSVADAAALGEWGAVTRLEGPTRYETAAAISQYAYPDGADVVVVATGENFPDALAAASAATALGGPVLLTPTGSLHQAAIDEITRLNPAEIIVAGGPAAISDAVFSQLSAMKPTIRIAGPNRYDTAVAISQHTFDNPALIDHIYVAVGTNFPDALAGAAAAAATGAPVLLTPTDALPQSVIDEITRLAPSRIFILGGTAVISQAVENQLAALLP